MDIKKSSSPTSSSTTISMTTFPSESAHNRAISLKCDPGQVCMELLVEEYKFGGGQQIVTYSIPKYRVPGWGSQQYVGEAILSKALHTYPPPPHHQTTDQTPSQTIHRILHYYTKHQTMVRIVWSRINGVRSGNQSSDMKPMAPHSSHTIPCITYHIYHTIPCITYHTMYYIPYIPYVPPQPSFRCNKTFCP